MGIDIDLIKRITTVSSEDLAKYRDKNKIKRKDIDNKKIKCQNEKRIRKK